MKWQIFEQLFEIHIIIFLDEFDGLVYELIKIQSNELIKNKIKNKMSKIWINP